MVARTADLQAMRLLAVFLLVGAIPSIAGAQVPTPTDPPAADPIAEPTTDAAAEFDRGKQAFEVDDYVQALAAFQHAQSLQPHDVVRFNIGLCYERLGRFGEALVEYEHAGASDQLDEATRADAQARAERVRTRLGRLVISEPAAAHVSIAGVERCTTPCSLDLDPGTYPVRVQGGFSDFTRSVVIARGQTFDLREEVEEPVHEDPPGSGRRLPSNRLRIGPIGWIGAGVAVLGTVGTILLGLRASSLHSSYVEDPTRDRLESGRTAAALTNVSIITALLGVGTFVLDVFVLEPRWAARAQAEHDLALGTR